MVANGSCANDDCWWLSLLLPVVVLDAVEFLLLSAPLPWLLLAAVGVRADDVDDDDTFTAVAGVVVVVVVAADMAIVLMTAGTEPMAVEAAFVVAAAFVLLLLLLLIEEFVVVPVVMELLLTSVSLPTLPMAAAVVLVRSVTSPEVVDPWFAASLPGLSGALGCPSSGEGAIVRFRQQFHYRPVAEVSASASRMGTAVTTEYGECISSARRTNTTATTSPTSTNPSAVNDEEMKLFTNHCLG